MKTLVLGMTSLVAGVALCDLAVDRLRTQDVDVSADASQQDHVWFADDAVKLEKGGKGTWKLPTSAVQTRVPMVLGVRAGTVRLTEGAEPVEMEAPACLAKSALWLDASKGSSLVGTDAGVSRWMDVRENADGTVYYCAEAKPNAGTGTTSYPVRKSYEDKQDLTYVNFNGKASGSWMRLLQPGTRADVATLSQIRHVFLCGYVEKAWGYPLGANDGSDEFWHPADASGGLSYYALAYSSSRKMISGDSLLNGRLFDPMSTVVKPGAYLYEWDSANDFGYFGNFYNDRNIWSRCGGDSIGEVVVFTNRLTVLEREAVGEYLMRKWVKARESGGFDVRLAKGATLETADLQGVAVSGAGTLGIVGENADILYAVDRAFEGKTRPLASQVRLETSEPALRLVSGDVLAVAADNYRALDVSRSSDAEKSAAGQVVASVGDNAEIRVTSLPDDVKTVSASGGGEVVLSAPRSSTVLDAGEEGVYATMPNADMEEWKRVSGAAFEGKNTEGETFCHWKIEENTAGSLYFLDIGAAKILGAWIIDGAVKSNFSYTDYPFEGNGIMVLAKGKTVSNRVTFPADGDYELTFLSGGRMNGPTSGTPNEYAGGILKMSLVDDGGVENKIGTALGYVGSAQQFQRFRVPGVKAGTQTFKLKLDVGANDVCMILDDFKFRRVTDGSRETVVRPPNAAFECASFTWEKVPETRRANLPDDWTFETTQPSTSKPDVCLVTRGFVNTSFRPGAEYGGVQLAFFGNGGTATSAAFTLPAGTWRLRFKKATLESESIWCKWNEKTLLGQSAVSAALVVGQEERSFGTSTQDTVARLTKRVMPTAVTLMEPASVQLRLRGATAAAAASVPCAIVDELELVRETEADEFIRNGTFVDATGWSLKSDKSYLSNCGAQVADPCRLAAGVSDFPYGTTYGVNRTALQINHYGAAEQRLDFPEKGTYRLEYSSRGRVWVPADASKPADMSYAGNRARFYLVGEDGATNEIAVSAALDTTNFVFRSCVFEISNSGTYTFGVMGVNGMPLPDGSRVKSYRKWETEATFFIDQISVKKVPTAQPEISEAVALDFGTGTRLRLDFAGTKKIGSIRLNGHRTSGLIDASHRSGLVTGPGKLYAEPNGAMLIVR